MRIGEEEGRPRARGRRGARRKWRCHSCGHREATEATGLCIPACPGGGGGGGRSRGLSGFGAGEEEQGFAAAAALCSHATEFRWEYGTLNCSLYSDGTKKKLRMQGFFFVAKIVKHTRLYKVTEKN